LSGEGRLNSQVETASENHHIRHAGCVFVKISNKRLNNEEQETVVALTDYRARGVYTMTVEHQDETIKQEKPELIYRGYQDFIKHDFPPREHVLAPWFPTRGVAMIAGYRGLGKTYLTLSIAVAIASGGELLGWKAEKPRPVLYVDGEMDPAELQDRLRDIAAAMVKDGNGSPEALAQNLFLLCDGDQKEGMPDLAGEAAAGRKRIEAVLRETGAEVLALDNLSSLFRDNGGATDNEQESWTIAQNWLRKLRRDGFAVLLIHHTGKPDKNGNTKQRGTSKHEDILNTSILLKPPSEKEKKLYNFKLSFTKHRGFVPRDDFMVEIVHKGGECRVSECRRNALLLEMRAQGKTEAEIAEFFGVDQSTVSRWLSKLDKDRAAKGMGNMQAPPVLHIAA
jgi:RecA-family ATPase